MFEHQRIYPGFGPCLPKGAYQRRGQQDITDTQGDNYQYAVRLFQNRPKLIEIPTNFLECAKPYLPVVRRVIHTKTRVARRKREWLA